MSWAWRFFLSILAGARRLLVRRAPAAPLPDLELVAPPRLPLPAARPSQPHLDEDTEPDPISNPQPVSWRTP